MNRLSIFTIAFLAAVSAFSPSAAYPKEPPLLTNYTSVIRISRPVEQPGPNIAIKYTDRLCINRSASYRTAVLKNEQAGTKDLCDLAKSAHSEEFWVLLSEKDLWLEISFGESLGSAKIDQGYLENIISENDELAMYHIHLRNYLRSLEKKDYPRIPETWLALPSLEDIAFMIYYSSKFNNEHPQGKISWHICSPLGVTEYSLTEKGKRHYGNIQQNTFLLRYLCSSNAKDINSKLTPFFDIRSPHKIQDLISWANIQGKGYIKIRFTPYLREKGNWH